MKSEYELSIKDYIAIIKDRALLLGIVIVVVVAATIGVAISVPPIYQSTGTILVESQQISPDLVSGGNNTFADERIEVIRQRVMTRENLLRIIDKYNLFADRGSRFSETDKIEQMRSAIVVATLSTYVKGAARPPWPLRFPTKTNAPKWPRKWLTSWCRCSSTRT